MRHVGRLYTYTIKFIWRPEGPSRQRRLTSSVVRDSGIYLGHDLFVRLAGVDGVDGVDGPHGVVLGHVRVVVGNDVAGRKRRFFLRNDLRLSKRLAKLRDGLSSSGKLDNFETP